MTMPAPLGSASWTSSAFWKCFGSKAATVYLMCLGQMHADKYMQYTSNFASVINLKQGAFRNAHKRYQRQYFEMLLGFGSITVDTQGNCRCWVLGWSIPTASIDPFKTWAATYHNTGKNLTHHALPSSQRSVTNTIVVGQMWGWLNSEDTSSWGSGMTCLWKGRAPSRTCCSVRIAWGGYACKAMVDATFL